jgi:2-dehydro-3-deoxyphosphogluconate aldolase/(4S)-4-hydroxy-2-oxoglutarate aldolase
MDAIAADRVLAVVRAPHIPDPAALCAALAEGGIRTVEFTFTTPGAAKVLAAAAAAAGPGRQVGAGTVLTAEQAAEAIDAGAEFLVTPAVRPEVAAVAARHGIPVLPGAFSPTEVAQAMDPGTAAVKIFPASALGPSYLKDLRGPFPDVRLVPSGGVSTDNARAFLEHGALAVCCGPRWSRRPSSRRAGTRRSPGAPAVSPTPCADQPGTDRSPARPRRVTGVTHPADLAAAPQVRAPITAICKHHQRIMGIACLPAGHDVAERSCPERHATPAALRRPPVAFMVRGGPRPGHPAHRARAAPWR